MLPSLGASLPLSNDIDHKTHMYGPGSPPRALKHRQVSSTMRGPFT